MVTSSSLFLLLVLASSAVILEAEDNWGDNYSISPPSPCLDCSLCGGSCHGESPPPPPYIGYGVPPPPPPPPPPPAAAQANCPPTVVQCCPYPPPASPVAGTGLPFYNYSGSARARGGSLSSAGLIILPWVTALLLSIAQNPN